MWDLKAHHEDRGAVSRHAIKQSRAAAIAFLLGFPLNILGIAITGLGLVATIDTVAGDTGNDDDDDMPDDDAAVQRLGELARTCLAVGPGLTWASQALAKALHGARDPKVHNTKVAAFVVGAA